MNIDSPRGISGAGSISDINDGGTVSTSQALTGNVVSVDSLGRADILLNVGSFAGVEVIAYIADAAHLKLVEIDSVLGVAGGTAIGQGTNTGTFTSNATLSGTLVFGTQGTSVFGPTATAGLFTADGAGNVVSGVFDNNAGGGTFNGSLTGTYSVDTSATGRGTVSLEILIGNTGMLSTFAFYLSGDGSPPMFLELDSNSVTTGTAFQQAAAPFSAASFTGRYGLSLTDFDEFGDVFDATARAVADGAGSLAGTADVNSLISPYALDGSSTASNIPGTGVFTANSNGRFTGTLTMTGSSLNGAFYIVDSKRVLFIQTDTAFRVTLGMFELQQSVP